MSKKRILVFILISYGFSWLVWFRPALGRTFGLEWTISNWNHLFAGLGPLLGALATTYIFERSDGIKGYLKRRLFSWPPLNWLLVGIGMPVVFFIIPLLFLGIFQNEWVGLGDIGSNSKLPLDNTWSVWLIWCLFYGLGEEGGWRGFLFPEFCKNHSARLAAFYTAIIWATWHLPLFIYDKDFQTMGLMAIIGWLMGLIFGSLLLGWLVKQSDWVLWPVIIWHGTFNFFTASDFIDPLFPGIMSALVIASGMWIGRKYGEDLEGYA